MSMRKPTTILLISAVIIFLAEVYIAGWFNAFWTWAIGAVLVGLAWGILQI